ncbi:hypothetical protein ACFQ0M_48375 [Kitasatospora aburaviensis]
MNAEDELLEGELVDSRERLPALVDQPAAGLDISTFHRDTVLVAGEPLPAVAGPVAYTARDFVISEETARLVRTAGRKNTVRNTRNQVKLFEKWCAERGRVALPCTTATLIEYVGWMINSGRYDPTTIQVYSSSVVTWQERSTPGKTRPGTIEVRAMIAAFRARWAKSNTEKQSPAVREADLEAMLATCEQGRPADLRDAALLALGWHLLTRRIELAHLVVTHLTIHQDGIDVRLVNRKTRKDGSVFEGWVPARDDARSCARCAGCGPGWSTAAASISPTSKPSSAPSTRPAGSPSGSPRRPARSTRTAPRRTTARSPRRSGSNSPTCPARPSTPSSNEGRRPASPRSRNSPSTTGPRPVTTPSSTPPPPPG